MNAKKAKMIRRAIRSEGMNPMEAKYNHQLPYISSWQEEVEHPLTKQKVQVRRTSGPLELEGCGKKLYRTVKRDLTAAGTSVQAKALRFK